MNGKLCRNQGDGVDSLEWVQKWTSANKKKAQYVYIVCSHFRLEVCIKNQQNSANQ